MLHPEDVSNMDLSCEENRSPTSAEYIIVYYKAIKREINRKLIYECRCDERLNAKAERSTRLGYKIGPQKALFFDVFNSA
jgi:hypothetical protein